MCGVAGLLCRYYRSFPCHRAPFLSANSSSFFSTHTPSPRPTITTYFAPVHIESSFSVYYSASLFNVDRASTADGGGGSAVVVVVVVVIVVLTLLSHRYNAVRGHRTIGSNNSGLEWKITSGGKQIQTGDNTHNNSNKSYTSDKNEKVRSAYVRIKIHIYIIC